MNVIQNQLKVVTYDNNTLLPISPKPDPSVAQKPLHFYGLSGRYPYPHSNDDFEQVRRLYRDVLSTADRNNLIDNICYSLSACRPEIQQNMLKIFYMVDQDYGARVEKGLGSAQGGSMMEKLAKKVGLSADKSHTTIGTTPEMDLSI